MSACAGAAQQDVEQPLHGHLAGRVPERVRAEPLQAIAVRRIQRAQVALQVLVRDEVQQRPDPFLLRASPDDRGLLAAVVHVVAELVEDQALDDRLRVVIAAQQRQRRDEDAALVHEGVAEVLPVGRHVDAKHAAGQVAPPPDAPREGARQRAQLRVPTGTRPREPRGVGADLAVRAVFEQLHEDGLRAGFTQLPRGGQVQELPLTHELITRGQGGCGQRDGQRLPRVGRHHRRTRRRRRVRGGRETGRR